jgi:hypothetical protein
MIDNNVDNYSSGDDGEDEEMKFESSVPSGSIINESNYNYGDDLAKALSEHQGYKSLQGLHQDTIEDSTIDADFDQCSPTCLQCSKRDTEQCTKCFTAAVTTGNGSTGTMTASHETSAEITAAGAAVDETLRNLRIWMEGCRIFNNAGVGIRVTESSSACKKSCSGGAVCGSIAGCSCSRNLGGDILCVHEGGDMPAVQKANVVVTTTCDSHPANSTSANSVPPVDYIIWEFERDDPRQVEDSAANDTDVLAPVLVGISLSPCQMSTSVSLSWVQYDEKSSRFLEEAYNQWLSGTIPLETADSNSDGESDGESISNNLTTLASFGPGSKVRLPEPLSRYVVDLDELVQTNTQTGYIRAVRRRPCISRT